MKTYLYSILFYSIAGPLFSHAQESPNKNEIPPAKLAIIAIGPKPPRRFGPPEEGKPNSAAALLPPKPDEIPPKKLFIGSEKSINVTFNSPSHFIDVEPNKSLNLQRRESMESDFTDYVSLTSLKPGSMTLLLLRPAGAGEKRWAAKPVPVQIDLLDNSLKTKKLAILNLSRRPIKSIFHKEKQMIPSGGIQTYESIDGLELHRIAAAYGQENKIIFNTALRLSSDSRLLLYVLYDSNPNTNDGRTVGLFRTSMELETELNEDKKKSPTPDIPKK